MGSEDEMRALDKILSEMERMGGSHATLLINTPLQLLISNLEDNNRRLIAAVREAREMYLDDVDGTKPSWVVREHRFDRRIQAILKGE